MSSSQNGCFDSKRQRLADVLQKVRSSKQLELNQKFASGSTVGGEMAKREMPQRKRVASVRLRESIESAGKLIKMEAIVDATPEGKPLPTSTSGVITAKPAKRPIYGEIRPHDSASNSAYDSGIDSEGRYILVRNRKQAFFFEVRHAI